MAHTPSRIVRAYLEACGTWQPGGQHWENFSGDNKKQNKRTNKQREQIPENSEGA